MVAVILCDLYDARQLQSTQGVPTNYFVPWVQYLFYYNFQDKDFNYIKILTEVWICEVFLCLVHVYRYWKEKILPSAKVVGIDGSEMVCPGDQKKELYQLLQVIFRSPTEEIYEVKLLTGLNFYNCCVF
jgi:hypothetical protein